MKKKQENNKYSVSLKVLGKIFLAEGDSVVDAIRNLKVGVARGSSILVVSHGGKEKERVIGMVLTNRLFNARGMTQEVALKNISLMFDGI